MEAFFHKWIRLGVTGVLGLFLVAAAQVTARGDLFSSEGTNSDIQTVSIFAPQQGGTYHNSGGGDGHDGDGWGGDGDDHDGDDWGGGGDDHDGDGWGDDDGGHDGNDDHGHGGSGHNGQGDDDDDHDGDNDHGHGGNDDDHDWDDGWTGGDHGGDDGNGGGYCPPPTDTIDPAAVPEPPAWMLLTAILMMAGGFQLVMKRWKQTPVVTS